MLIVRTNQSNQPIKSSNPIKPSTKRSNQSINLSHQIEHANATATANPTANPTADIDTAALMADSRGIDETETGYSVSLWCNWSDDPEILKALLAEFRGAGAGAEADGGMEVAEAAASGVQAAEDEEPAGAEGGDEEWERSDVHMHLSEVGRVSTDRDWFLLACSTGVYSAPTPGTAMCDTCLHQC